MLNRKALQRELDLAAEELEKSGSPELAAKVDICNAKLQTASAKDVPMIRKALMKIQELSDRKTKRVAKPTVDRERLRKRLALMRLRKAALLKAKEKAAKKEKESALEVDGDDAAVRKALRIRRLNKMRAALKAKREAEEK